MTIVVIYESTRGRTKAMAEAICEGVSTAKKECQLVDAKDFETLNGACAIAVGSSTRMKKPLPRVRVLLAEMESLENLKAAAFGSYGWSGEAPDEIAAELVRLGAKLVEEKPLKVKDYPNEEMLEVCRALGKKLADSC